MARIEYRPEDVSVKIGGRIIFSIDEVEVTRAEPEWVLEPSTNGKVSYRHQPAKHGSLRVVVSQENPEDIAYLRDLHASGEQFPSSVTVTSGPQDSSVLADCHIEQQAPQRFANEDPAWEFNILSPEVVFKPSTKTPATGAIGTNV